MSSATARTPDAASGASSKHRTNAEPTMTPSQYPATSAAWAPLVTPSPMPIGRSVAARTRWTSTGAAALVLALAPVTPITEVA